MKKFFFLSIITLSFALFAFSTSPPENQNPIVDAPISIHQESNIVGITADFQTDVNTPLDEVNFTQQVETENLNLINVKQNNRRTDYDISYSTYINKLTNTLSNNKPTDICQNNKSKSFSFLYNFRV
jgi:hypothetical protein